MKVIRFSLKPNFSRRQQNPDGGPGGARLGVRPRNHVHHEFRDSGEGRGVGTGPGAPQPDHHLGRNHNSASNSKKCLHAGFVHPTKFYSMLI